MPQRGVAASENKAKERKDQTERMGHGGREGGGGLAADRELQQAWKEVNPRA